MYKRAAALVLCAVMLLSHTVIGETPFVQEANENQHILYTEPKTVTVAQASAKLEKLCGMLEGKFFTTDGVTCGNNSCEKCFNQNVIASDWFKGMFGEMSTDCFAGHGDCDSANIFPRGWSCAGFASFAQYYIFTSANTDKLSMNVILRGVPYNYETVRDNVLPGDIIRFGTKEGAKGVHSVVFISCDENNITYLDCNGCASCGKNVILKNTVPYTWSGWKYMTVTRAANYDTASDSSTVPDDCIMLTVGSNEALAFGKSVKTDAPPVIENERTMLPARFVAEALGATVSWNSADKCVTIEKDDVKMLIFVDSDKSFVNGELVFLDSPAFVRDDRTYLPVRFICENLGANVAWNGETQTVMVTEN